MKNLTLIGMPGAGKSTIGVLLAKALGYTFLDTDLLIQSREGKLLQALVDDLGADGFIELESNTICSVTCERTVIAPGGSAVCVQRACQHLKALGPVVYLCVPFEELETRLSNISSRGIAMMPGQTLRDIYDYRSPLYEDCADVILDVGHQSLEETVTALLALLHQNKSDGFHSN